MPPAWRSETVAGRRVDVCRRSGPSLLFLHDLDGANLANNPTITALLEELGITGLAPPGGPRWWADRWLWESLVPSAGPGPVGLVGVGLGGQGALRLAFDRPQTFPAVAAVNAAIDLQDLYGQGTPLDELYDSREECRQDSAVLHVSPARQPPHVYFACDRADPSWRGNDRLHEKLTALGVPHEADLSARAADGPRSYLNRQLERAVRFVHAGLVREARRLL